MQSRQIKFMGVRTILLALVLCYQLIFHDGVQCSWNLPKEEELDIERQQLKLLNKPAMKTIVNKYGDIFGCVDFYKQLAFDHPLLKNHTFGLQIKSSEHYNETTEQVGKSFHEESDVEICPVGSVPIRRINKGDLIRQRHTLEGRRMESTNRPGTYLAVARTKASKDVYTGSTCSIGIHNPRAFGRQFSTTRVKLQRGPNSIEAGWRVDPTLYGDRQTRFFVRTDAGRSHCFNTYCPGFVHVNRKFPLDSALGVISFPGGLLYDLPVRILRDNASGNWNLIIGTDNDYIGYWPSRIFTGLPDYIEWGGAAYAPPGSPLPPMGSGEFPRGDTSYDGFVRNIKVLNSRGKAVDAINIERYADDYSLYSVNLTSSHGGEWGRVILYGGPGHRKVV